MRRNLLGSDSFEENLHISHMRENKRVGVSVVGVHISLVVITDLISVVSLTVFSFVLWLNTKTNMNYKTVLI